MKKSIKIVIVGGFILLLLIINSWTKQLSEVRIGKEYESIGWMGNSPEMAASLRSGINQKYGLWTIIVVLGTVVFIYINKDKNASKSKLLMFESTQPSNLQSEIDTLKAKIAELEKK
ncbi:hypothetical protein [Desulfosporosinus nitroreducens]|uniref:hypothetical protein n=1 Tax=Desulfosporosinus nitroreducens TaxID=2018668 RepID=UPI00207C722C|nr:hypothetical protein [Desulfosporosinus nitroreducens]MCO1601600.1 hypothetical protein [Desulfosporosinus nitroreducens]